MRSAPAIETRSANLQQFAPQEVRRRFAEDETELISQLHSHLVARGASDLEQLRFLARCDNAEIWRGKGAKTTSEWAAAQLGISRWKASRMINAGHALASLPLISAHLERGSLSLDKVIELTRFAAPETEKRLVKWARRVTPAGIRDRADKLAAKKIEEVKGPIEGRTLSWWHIDEDRLWLEGVLPADQGAIVCAAIDRLAGTLPDLPPDDGHPELDREYTIAQRRADAIVQLASTQIAKDQDPDLATVVVNVDLKTLASGVGNAEIDLGPSIHFETARRLSCDCRLEVARIDGLGDTVGIDRASRNVPRWLRRQLMRRDGHTCQFPGCGATRFLHAHHIWHWSLGGPTNLDNLIAVCPTHHKLVHEFGWGVSRSTAGEVTWFRSSGRVHDPGPAPPPDERLDHSHPKRSPLLIEARRYSRLIGVAATF